MSRDDQVAVHTIGEPTLRAVAGPASRRTLTAAALRELAGRLRSAVADHRAAGLTAPQLGVALRVIALNGSEMCQIAALDGAAGGVVVHLDPTVRVLNEDDQVADFEECLSIPGLAGVVRRPRRVFYRAVRLEGGEVAGELVNRAARVVQHQIDHLDGVLLVDRCPSRSLLTVAAVERTYRKDAAAAAKALGFTA